MAQIMNKNMLVSIGEALIDFIPGQKGCRFQDVTEFSPKCGGAPANVCGAYTVLGGQSRLITQLGNDPFGHKIEEELRGYGIDTSSVLFTEKANTALAFVSLAEDGNRTFSFYRKPSADMLLKKEQIQEKWFEEAYVLHFCSVSLGDFSMKDAHKAAISLARKHNALISFDFNLRFMLWDNKEKLKAAVWEFIPEADIIKVSDEELEFVTGETEIEKALPQLFCGNVKLVIYTCGASGAYAFTRENKVYVEGKKVKAIDTTGAGDGFIGSFLYHLNRLGITKDQLEQVTEDVLEVCITYSNDFCAKSVTKQGAIASYEKNV